MSGPSPHLTWSELGCWNRLPLVFKNVAPGERIAPYPMAWRETRAVMIAETFEEIRAALGAEPITINSGFRTESYNNAIVGADRSQHPQGRAIDIRHPEIAPRALFEEILRLYKAGDLPRLGGLGSYASFVHFDVRPRVGDRLAVWHY